MRLFSSFWCVKSFLQVSGKNLRLAKIFYAFPGNRDDYFFILTGHKRLFFLDLGSFAKWGKETFESFWSFENLAALQDETIMEKRTKLDFQWNFKKIEFQNEKFLSIETISRLRKQVLHFPFIFKPLHLNFFFVPHRLFVSCSQL